MNHFNKLMKPDIILMVAFICLVSAPAGPMKYGSLGLVLLLFTGSLAYRIRHIILYKKCPFSTCTHS
jgi:hypothetical protein